MRSPNYVPPPVAVLRAGMAIAALVLGIFSLVAWFLPIAGRIPIAIPGLILAILARGGSRRTRTLALWAIILCAIGLVLRIVSVSLGAQFATQSHPH